MKTRYLVGIAAALALLLFHAALAAVVVDREVAGRLLSAAGWLDPEPFALGVGFLAVRAVVFLVLPAALVLLATAVVREFRHGRRDR
jgi:hypothetical protein